MLHAALRCAAVGRAMCVPVIAASDTAAAPHHACQVAFVHVWRHRQRAALAQLRQPPACLLADVQVGLVDGRTLHNCL